MNGYEGSLRVYNNLIEELSELAKRNDVSTATIDALRFAAQVAANVTNSLSVEEDSGVEDFSELRNHLSKHTQYR